MKRSTKTIALLLVLVLLCGGYFYLQKVTETSKVSEESGSFALTDKTVDDLTGISWTLDGTAYHFVKEEGVWVNADDSAFPADQDAVQDLADDLIGLEADRKLENIKNVADYGLSEPTFTVTGKWSDGTSSVYSMGDETPFSDGYYVNLSGDDTIVYTVGSSLSTLFSKTLADLAVMEEIPTVEQVTRLTVGSALDASWSEISTTLDAGQNWYDTATGTPLNDDTVETLISAAESVAWSELLTASASDEELASWSLTEDAATAVTVYDGSEVAFTLLIGTTDASGNYYVRLSGSAMVYSVTSDSVSALVSTDASSVENTSLVPLTFENLTEAVFTLEGSSHTFQCSKTEVTEEETAVVTLNGEETDAAAAETLWNLVSALTIAGTTDEVPAGDALISVSATNESSVSASFEFFAFDADSYLVMTSDGRALLTPADAIDKLIRNVRQLG